MKKGIYAAAAGLAVFFLALAGCDDLINPEEPEVYIVRFEKNTDDDRGTRDAIPKNKKVTRPAMNIDRLPADPIWQGYQFIGWYTSKDKNNKGEKFDEVFDVIRDMVVYAHWQTFNVNACIVIFNSNGGSAISNPAVEITVNKSFSQLNKDFPPDPTWEGYIFEGWYTKQKGGDPFTINTVVKDDITVYAQWKEESEQEPAE